VLQRARCEEFERLELGGETMSGVNAVMSSMATLINALANAINGKLTEGSHKKERKAREKPAGKDKPRAKWISQEERDQLARERKCFRCKKKGHFGRDCPRF